MVDAHFEDDDSGQRYRVIEVDGETVEMRPIGEHESMELTFREVAEMMDDGLRFVTLEAHKNWHRMGGF